MLKSKICPLLSISESSFIPCKGQACAWWDYLASSCRMVSAADNIRAVSDALDDLSGEAGADE